MTLDITICCQKILAHCKDPYARAYAKVLAEMVEMDEPQHAIHTQLLYVRSNLAHWRGQEARLVKGELDRLIAETREAE